MNYDVEWDSAAYGRLWIRLLVIVEAAWLPLLIVRNL